MTDIMPGIAKVCDRLAVVRTMSHKTSNHNPGVYLAITGRTSVRDQAGLDPQTHIHHPPAVPAPWRTGSPSITCGARHRRG